MEDKEMTAATWEALTAAGYNADPPVELDVSPEMMVKLMNRTTGQWKKLGEEDPYWSILTDEINRGKTLTPKNEERFYRTGDSAIHLLKMFEHRNKVNLSRGVCFELGCGVGRLTRNLAANFDHVIAVDISPGNLAIAKKRFNQDGIKNVEFWLIKDFSDFDKLPDFDVFYSMIVLQHNTPPLQKAILSSVLPKCKSGTLFQTATNLIEYRFVAEEYLTYPDEGMEVHPLPQYSVNELLRSTGLKLHETLPDTFIGTYGSNTFFASR